MKYNVVKILLCVVCLCMGKFRDLTGQVFGRLTVLKRVEDHVSKAGRKEVVWLCKCVCGNELRVTAHRLLSGNTQSCGCYKKDRTSVTHTKDLVGQVFGRLTVLCRNGSRIRGGCNYAVWSCVCECGNQVDVVSADLIHGHTKSCGCLYSEHIKQPFNFDDLVGQRFGRLVVKYRVADYIAPSGAPHVQWCCLCDCGNECHVTTHNLKSGNTKSCGCYQKEQSSQYHQIDLVGFRFGKLLVLENMGVILEKSGKHVVGWLCLCDCGQQKIVKSTSLLSGDCNSCGCLKLSKGELFIIQYLSNRNYVQNVDYICQRKYDDLIGVGGGSLSYDFAIYHANKLICLIECQGEQHYKPVDYFGGEIQFEIQQEHDRRKREYAESIGVPLLEIPYTADTYEKVAEILQQAGI